MQSFHIRKVQLWLVQKRGWQWKGHQWGIYKEENISEWNSTTLKQLQCSIKSLELSNILRMPHISFSYDKKIHLILKDNGIFDGTSLVHTVASPSRVHKFTFKSFCTALKNRLHIQCTCCNSERGEQIICSITAWG